MTQEEYDKLIITRIKELQKICEEKGVTPIILYNTDQTGLFYQKLPNSLYIEKKQNKYFDGTKDIKEKPVLLYWYDLLQMVIYCRYLWL